MSNGKYYTIVGSASDGTPPRPHLLLPVFRIVLNYFPVSW